MERGKTAGMLSTHSITASEQKQLDVHERVSQLPKPRLRLGYLDIVCHQKASGRSEQVEKHFIPPYPPRPDRLNNVSINISSCRCVIQRQMSCAAFQTNEIP